MKSFIQSHLKEDFLADGDSLKTNLGYLDSGMGYFMDLPWFKEHFPDEPTMRHAVDTYNVLNTYGTDTN